MPRVPPREQTVQDIGLPGVRLQGAPPSNSASQQIGETLQRLGGAMFQREVQAADQAAVLEAETQAGNAQLDIMQKMRDLRGKRSAEAEDFALGEFDQSVGALRNGLSSDRQRRMFDTVVVRRRDALRRSALDHFNKESEAYYEGEFKASLDQSVNTARSTVDSVRVLPNGTISDLSATPEKDFQEMNIRFRGQRLGLPDEEIKAQITSVHSRINREVIAGLLEKGQDRTAATFYKHLVTQERGADEATGQGRLQFTAQDRDAVEKALGEGSTRGEAHRQTMTILAEVGMDSAEQRRMALNKADTIEDEKVGELVRDKLEHRFAQEDKRKHEDYQATFSNATKLIDEQWKQVPAATAREMVPASVWATLSIQDRHTLDTYLAHFRDPGKRVTDVKTWATVNSWSDDELAKKSVSEMMAIGNKLDDGNRDSLYTRWNGVRNRAEGKKPDKKFEKLMSNEQYLNNALENSGHFKMDKPKKDWPDEDKMLWNDIQNEVGRELSKIEEGAKPEVIQKTVQGVVDKHLKQKFKYDKGFFSFEKDIPAGLAGRAMEKGGTLRIPLKDIPKDQQDQIRGMILDDPRKKSISTEKIEQIYAIKKRIDLDKATKKQLIEQLIGE